MQVPPAQTLDLARLDEALAECPNSDAVFLVWAGDRSAYLAKTSMLRRRLLRILKTSGGSPKRSLNLREVVTRVEYWPTASRFESLLVHYALAREHYPDDYLRLTKLRMPSYVKLVLSNEFPRTHVAARITGGAALYYGPFRSRAAAELFEDQFLDLFQLRRCQENLEPNPTHPGCIYGEMNRCLRPCQQVVTREEYASEAERVREFLAGDGAGLVSVTTAARDRLSDEMNFEAAAREHQHLERIESILKLRDDLVHDIDQFYGVAVAPSRHPESVLLWFVCRGVWQLPQTFSLTSGVSLDTRLRELAASIEPVTVPLAERQEHLALLARWHYSTWSDGEWIGFRSLADVPYRRLVRTISRVRQGLSKDAPQTPATSVPPA